MEVDDEGWQAMSNAQKILHRTSERDAALALLRAWAEVDTMRDVDHGDAVECVCCEAVALRHAAARPFTHDPDCLRTRTHALLGMEAT